MNLAATLQSIETSAASAGFTMGSEPLVGQLLATLAASKPGGRILEWSTGIMVATRRVLL